MHETMAALMKLHDVNQQRQVLIQERASRDSRLAEAEQKLAAARAEREAAEAAVSQSDALIRQYTADVERCDATMEKLRAQQMEARTNKEYLACINGIENAKSEKKLREESLGELQSQVEAKQAAVAAAQEVEAAAAQALEEVKTATGDGGEAESSQEELERIYQEHRAGVDPKFLEIYERLVSAKHPMPLMRVDARTRATPMGNMVSTQQLEILRLGGLVTDSATNAILYVDED